MKSKLSRKRKMLIVAIIFPLTILLGGCVFLHTPSFGRLPSGKRLKRIRRSPNYIDGEFRYPVKTEVMILRRKRPSCRMRSSRSHSESFP